MSIVLRFRSVQRAGKLTEDSSASQFNPGAHWFIGGAAGLLSELARLGGHPVVIHGASFVRHINESENAPTRQKSGTEQDMGRILVIDDDPEMRAMLEQTLKAAGHEVLLAADGKQGVDLYRAKPANVVITDLYMPVKGGLETVIELRRDFPEVAIIVISGVTHADATLSAARRLRAAKTIEKPFQPHELLAAVEEVLRDRKP